MSVPYAAGGPLDVMVRVLAEGLRPALGQSVVIENVAGAGGSIGVVRAARAAPDGYTISAGNWASHLASAAPSTRCRSTFSRTSIRCRSFRSRPI